MLAGACTCLGDTTAIVYLKLFPAYGLRSWAIGTGISGFIINLVVIAL